MITRVVTEPEMMERFYIALSVTGFMVWVIAAMVAINMPRSLDSKKRLLLTTITWVLILVGVALFLTALWMWAT